ncbi:alanyl-tRNA editing protein [Proteiniclasticum sp. C24MP]|uniref:alanyl-tRNA editing protein n=1 Tax=Proteiniclasticum sp. C24MP TaxID=3374101 RepID=UPI00375422D6
MKLYQVDQDVLRFTSRIRSVKEKEDGVYITLHSTYFYPEGGGQPADQGTVNGKEVLDVFSEGEEIYHKLASFSGLTINMPVECVIDQKVREDHSIQHTAQHVLTAVLKDQFGVETLSFHMGKVHATIDTDLEISEEVRLQAEQEVNDLIGKNLPVSTYYRDKYNLGDIPLRKAVQVDSNIRIVQIGEIDWCGCGGTHVKSLKDLRLFKITAVEKYKGGSRIFYVAGERAYRYLYDMEDAISKLKAELGVNLDELPFRVRQVKEERDEYRKAYGALTLDLARALVENYEEDTVVQEVEYEDELIKAMGNHLMKKEKIAVFYRKDGRIFIFTGESADAKELVRPAREEFRFRGGGGKTMQQGFIEVSEEIGPFISRIYEGLLKLEL